MFLKSITISQFLPFAFLAVVWTFIQARCCAVHIRCAHDARSLFPREKETKNRRPPKQWAPVLKLWGKHVQKTRSNPESLRPGLIQLSSPSTKAGKPCMLGSWIWMTLGMDDRLFHPQFSPPGGGSAGWGGREEQAREMSTLPGFLSVRVLRGVNLVSRDAKGSDPYVVLNLDGQVDMFINLVTCLLTW